MHLRTAQLESLNRELEAFSYSVSHDLRAPLRAVNGFLQALVEDCGAALDERGLGHVAAAQEGAGRMSHLIEDLLKLAGLARREIQRIDVDLADIARSVARRLHTEEPAREVELVIQDVLPAQADAGLVSVVMENLIGNAWKYTGKTARARIEVGIRAEPDGGRTFFVRDNGVGFDAKRADNLFSPFQRMHSAAEFPGTGVGLATVQRIIHRHGGRIWAESEPGRGATFAFTLPGVG